HGQEYTEPPPAMIVEAILRHVYGTAPAPAPARRYELPENLGRFFAGKAAPARPTQSIVDTIHGSPRRVVTATPPAVPSTSAPSSRSSAPVIRSRRSVMNAVGSVGWRIAA
ncbi:MAG: hypothetical protein ACRDST_17335, partial [Pseudonocardiaceae bacterium]